MSENLNKSRNSWLRKTTGGFIVAPNAPAARADPAIVLRQVGRVRIESNLGATPDGGDDLIGIGGPDERLGAVVGFGEEVLNGGLEIDERRSTPRLSRRLLSLAKKPSTTLSQEADFGV